MQLNLFHNDVLVLVERLDADRRDAFEERAAIMEYDGGMSRAEAELAAYVLVTEDKEWPTLN